MYRNLNSERQEKTANYSPQSRRIRVRRRKHTQSQRRVVGFYRENYVQYLGVGSYIVRVGRGRTTNIREKTRLSASMITLYTRVSDGHHEYSHVQ